MVAGLIAGIISAIGGLIAINVGGVMLGLVVFFAIFLLLSGGGLTFLAGVSPNAIIILIIIVIVYKLATSKK